MFLGQVTLKLEAIAPVDFNEPNPASWARGVERVWQDGAVKERIWALRIPSHRQKWAEKQVEKGYTVMVTFREFRFISNPAEPGASGYHAEATIDDIIAL